MANTIAINHSLGILTIAAPDSDFDFCTTYQQYGNGIFIDFVGYNGIANDMLRLKQLTDAGIDIMPPLVLGIAGSSGCEMYGDRLYKPYFDYSACTFSSAATTIILIRFRPGEMA